MLQKFNGTKCKRKLYELIFLKKILVYKECFIEHYGNESMKNEYMIQKWFDKFRYRDDDDDYDTPV